MRRHLEDDIDDMEAGFDEVEREERISRHIGNKEDQEQLRYIQMEEMNEKRVLLCRYVVELVCV